MFEETIRILVIGNEIFSHLSLVEKLEKKGCALDLVKSSKNALIMAEYSYHLIFIEYELSKVKEININGIELAKKIRQWEKINNVPRRPSIMVYGSQKDNKTEIGWKEVGIDACYKKPLNLEDVDTILAEYIKVGLITEREILYT